MQERENRRIDESEISRALLETIDYLRTLTWTLKIWTPTPALIDKKGGSSRQYVGQRFDPNYINLVPDGWTHDHCEICGTRITNIEGYGEPKGYEANGDWIWCQCYDRWLQKTYPESGSNNV